MIYTIFLGLFFYLFIYLLNINFIYTIYFSYISFLNFTDSNLKFLTIFFLLFLSYNRFLVLFLFPYFFKLHYNLIFIKSIIPNLVVGTILIHPLIFYFSVSLSLTLCFFFTFKLLLKLRLRQVILVSNLSLSMCLGGLWSLQSSSWGYFWVNDLIEWFLFFFILLLVYKQHIVKTTVISFYYYLIFNFFFNFLIFLRIGLFSTRHSFLPGEFYTLFIPLIIIFSTYYSNNFFFIKNYKINKIYQKVFFLPCFVKWLSIFFISYILRKNIIKNLLFFKAHLILFLFILIWNIVFFYFDGVFLIFKSLVFFKFNIFSISISGKLLMLFNKLSLILLTHISFLLSNLTFFITNFFSYSLFLTLNNYIILFILLKFSFFLRKTVWI